MTPAGIPVTPWSQWSARFDSQHVIRIWPIVIPHFRSWYNKPTWFTGPETVTHFSTRRAQCWLTLLITPTSVTITPHRQHRQTSWNSHHIALYAVYTAEKCIKRRQQCVDSGEVWRPNASADEARWQYIEWWICQSSAAQQRGISRLCARLHRRWCTI